MSGNCAIGICVSAISPASVMTTEMTTASRGRSMKMPDNIGSNPGLGFGRLNDLAGPHLLDALGDDQIAGSQGLWSPISSVPDGLAGFDPPDLHLVVLVDDQHEGAGLIELHRLLRDHAVRFRPCPAPPPR